MQRFFSKVGSVGLVGELFYFGLLAAVVVFWVACWRFVVGLMVGIFSNKLYEMQKV
jgi:hypothetical protein